MTKQETDTDTEPREGAEPDDDTDGYVCPLCQRTRHERCTDPECVCCLGNPDE
ncbi:MAG TPA: hypothetical protein VGG54_22830 [Trebonia sp.]